MRQTIPAVALALCALLLPARPLQAWGPTAHQAVVNKAIDTLPGGLKPFYKNHRLEIPSLSVEWNPGDEGADRRFALDRFGAFPFADLPRTEASLKERFPEAGPGRLPWLVQESYARLVEAFKSGDKARILAESDALAGYVADLTNPLALTENHDGHKTGQHGIWMRVSLKMAEAVAREQKLSPDAAHLLEVPGANVFGVMRGSWVWLDNLLYEEDLARAGKTDFTEIYERDLFDRAAPLVRRQLAWAAEEVGSYWYTAWTAAGRPALK